MKDAIKNKYDFCLIFDAENSNVNGDPDAGNQPRIDPETGRCFVTDVCLKRKIRNAVELRMEGTHGFKMYIKPDSTLNEKDEEAFKSIGCTEKTIAEYRKGNPETDNILRDFMCQNYYDTRTFGGVMTKFASAHLGCAAIRGPVQLSMAESISPVELRDITITRTAVATAAEAVKANNTFGNKPVISYGLFKCTGSISANLAQRYTGFSEEDLEIFWDSIMRMFDEDKSAIRPCVNVRQLIIFKHDSILGNAPSHKLFERIKISEKNPGTPIRHYDDYSIDINLSNMPSGVEAIIKD